MRRCQARPRLGVLGFGKKGSPLLPCEPIGERHDAVMSPRFSITLLGGFGARRGDTPVELPPGCQRVVAFLALARRPVDRDRVCTRLWPGVPPTNAIARLRSTLWRLRCCGAEGMLETDPRTFAIASGVHVDWWRAVDISSRILSTLTWTGAPDPMLLADLIPLLEAGDLLDGWSDAWAAPERCRYHAVRSLTLNRLADWSLDPENHNGAPEQLAGGASYTHALRGTAPGLYSRQSVPAASLSAPHLP